MTIKRQRVNAGSLVEVEADNTDTVDTLGISDAISVVGAKTAKFSDTSVMQANAGLRIGLTQLKINTGVIASRSRITISTTNMSDPANAIDGNLNTFGSINTAGIGVTVDFGSIGTTSISCKVRHATSGTMRSSLEISTDNIIWVEVSNISTSADTTFTHLGGTQTYRYARLVGITVSATLQIFEVFEGTLTGTTTVRVRSSATIDSTDGTILISDQVMNVLSQLTFDTELLLTGNAQFVTLEIVSFSGQSFDVSLSDITSIREEP